MTSCGRSALYVSEDMLIGLTGSLSSASGFGTSLEGRFLKKSQAYNQVIREQAMAGGQDGETIRSDGG